MTTPKPGPQTTEFWTTLFAQVIALAALFHPGLHAEKWTPLAQGAAVLAAAISSGLYAHGRAKVKTAVITGQALTAAEESQARAKPAG